MCKYNIQPLTHTNPPFPTYGVCVCVSVVARSNVFVFSYSQNS